ncbi:MAG TPA: hypothetical protein VGC91_08615 [Pyrinomonadaceae bacterium]|jgi:hypothetical protein
MKFLLLSFLLCLFVFTLTTSVTAQEGNAQEEIVKAVLLNHIVELVPKRENEKADFVTVSVLLDGKLIKQFAAQTVVFPNVVATYNGFDADYLLYRTFMGQGVCAGGELYVLRFYTFGEEPKAKIEVQISPALVDCLGENPWVEFTQGERGATIIKVNESKIDGKILAHWIKSSASIRSKRRKTK